MRMADVLITLRRCSDAQLLETVQPPQLARRREADDDVWCAGPAAALPWAYPERPGAEAGAPHTILPMPATCALPCSERKAYDFHFQVLSDNLGVAARAAIPVHQAKALTIKTHSSTPDVVHDPAVYTVSRSVNIDQQLTILTQLCAANSSSKDETGNARHILSDPQ